MTGLTSSPPTAPKFDGTQPCAGVPIEVFFPPVGGSTEPARAICACCPFRVACLDYAMEHPTSGIWGGTSEPERRRAARRRGLPYNAARTVLYAGGDGERGRQPRRAS